MDHRSRAAGGRLLRPVLLADAAVTGLNGIAYLALSGVLGDAFGIPATVLVVLGALLVLVAVTILVIVSRKPIPRTGVLAIAALNTAWVLASIGYAVAGALTAWGLAWVLLQAAVVAVFAALQWRLSPTS
ncbi:hypothetical protein EK0264_15270 [Epidermidibacterium keratini]|uniref:Integral membrane protein n=1 Tax=Epidermidibacterium keratini TaxID=1891644 RepID=A0A7L4YX36_9ACTN|nr:hypothetical protein EK0264_15270 [Epidermidibacterium keratini]